MNRTLYRIVFNALRGQLMAVAETVVARRRSTPGSTRRHSSTFQRARMLAATIALAVCRA